MSPESRLGGQLLALSGAGDTSALSEKVTSLVCVAVADHARYGAVLEWMVTSIAEVIDEKEGPIVGATEFAVAIRSPDGHSLAIEELPWTERHLWMAIIDALAGDLRQTREHLDPVVYSAGPEGQIRALIEATTLLDHLLDLPALNGPDTVSE